MQTYFDHTEHKTWIDLLDPTWERLLRREPEQLQNIIAQIKVQKSKSNSKGEHWIIIDEIQKLPGLLDIVLQSLAEDKSIFFALTGSSARKLKRDGANMLAGRALTYAMFALTSRELASSFNLQQALEFGTLPEAISANDVRERKKFLQSYCQTYMKEEVFAEQLARQLDPFRSFMECAAQDNGHILNYDNIAKKIGVSGKTVASYYSILEETYLGVLLFPVHDSVRKKIAQKPKFYFFDCGVQRALANLLDLPLMESTSAYGDAFEHWIILEAYRLNSLCETSYDLGYLDAHGGISIDLVLSKPRRSRIYIEIKSTKHVMGEHLRHLKTLRKSQPEARYLCISQDPIRRLDEGIEVIPWQEALSEIFIEPE